MGLLGQLKPRARVRHELGSLPVLSQKLERWQLDDDPRSVALVAPARQEPAAVHAAIGGLAVRLISRLARVRGAAARLPAFALEVQVEGEDCPDADADLLSAALLNLLDNAQRHGARHVRLEVVAGGRGLLMA